MNDITEKGLGGTPWLTAERLGAITDGVVAIIVTILVLEIKVPEDHDFGEEGVINFLWKIERPVFIYFVSFFLVWAYWLQHHVMFHYVTKTNRALVYLNGMFLFLLSLLPFTTELVGLYRGVPVVETIIGLNYLLSGLVLYVMWRYCISHPHLLRKSINANVERGVGRRILIAPAVSLVGILVALVYFPLGNLIFVTIPVYYLSHPAADTYWRSEE